MNSEAEILHYIFVVLSRSNYKICRVNTPDGYCVILKVGEVKFLFTREDIEALVRIESGMDCCLYTDLPKSMQRVLEYDSEKEDGK